MRNEKQMGGQLTERASPYLSAAHWGAVGVEREMREDHSAVCRFQMPSPSCGSQADSGDTNATVTLQALVHMNLINHAV